jgi:hypothetical protein
MRVFKRQVQIITRKALGTNKNGIKPIAKDKNKLQV